MRLFLLCIALCCGLLANIAQAQTLMSHVEVANTGQAWSYTLFNDEPANSPNYATSLYLSVDAPFMVTGAPLGWSYQAGNTYVLWLNDDLALPYPHDVAPGISLSGFTIETFVSTSSGLASYQVYSWDHGADNVGPVSDPQTILGPSAFINVPEPSSKVFVGTMILVFSGLFCRARKPTRHCVARTIKTI